MGHALHIGTVLVVVPLLLTACRQDEALSGPEPPQPAYILLSVDTACVMAPNIFTPDGDGMNDQFVVVTKNIVELSVTVRNTGGEEVIAFNDLYPQWDGAGHLPNEVFTVSVEALSASGVTLSGTAPLTILAYGSDSCLTHAGPSITGDQFDPRLCGPVYATQEVFCP